MIRKLRLLTQSISFVFLMYGGRLGVSLGHSLPCFACPYVSGCAGHCYLMAMQNNFGFGLAFADMLSKWGFHALVLFLIFIVQFIPLSKIWCGWICPFGTLQDWITSLRRKMCISESRFAWNIRHSVKIIKYLLLAVLIIIPICIANFGLHSDFELPFCQVCPAKPILPLFTWETRHLALDFTNSITLFFTALSLIISGMTITGMFFKDRFFCMFCPMLALMHIIRKVSFIRFEKTVKSCLGCGNCQRMCPVDIKEVYLEKENKDVMKDDCLLCMKCTEACPGDNVLSITFMKLTIFSSSKRYIAGKWGKHIGKK